MHAYVCQTHLKQAASCHVYVTVGLLQHGNFIALPSTPNTCIQAEIICLSARMFHVCITPPQPAAADTISATVLSLQRPRHCCQTLLPVPWSVASAGFLVNWTLLVPSRCSFPRSGLLCVAVLCYHQVPQQGGRWLSAGGSCLGNTDRRPVPAASPHISSQTAAAHTYHIPDQAD